MHKGRLEAFSDGVLAVIITIMVLELKTPHNGTLAALRPLLPVFAAYVLSFVMIGIYWNNHHHMFQASGHVNGRVLWANLHLLFWLSLIPFFTSWIGESGFALAPVAGFGVVLFLAGQAYDILARSLVAVDGAGSLLAQAMGAGRKGQISRLMYLAGIAAAFFHPLLGFAFYVAVAVMWFIPHRGIESVVQDHTH